MKKRIPVASVLTVCTNMVQEKHESNCIIRSPVRIDLADGPIRFKQYVNQIRHPIVIYADFESTLQKIHGAKSDPTKSFHLNKYEHIPNSFCVYTKCEVDKHSKLEIFEGPDADARFVAYMISETQWINLLMNTNKPMILTDDEIQHHFNATQCYVCEEPFTEDNYKVSDHNYLTGEYSLAAHNLCNLLIRQYKYIPVFMNNLSNYDPHLFINEFGKVEGDLRVIPQTDDKYISISKYIRLRVVNSAE